jgi:hypothetical protein
MVDTNDVDRAELDVAHPSLRRSTPSPRSSSRSNPSPLAVLEASARRAARVLERRSRITLTDDVCRLAAGSLTMGSGVGANVPVPLASVVAGILDEGQGVRRPGEPVVAEDNAMFEERRKRRRSEDVDAPIFSEEAVLEGLEDPSVALLLASAENRRAVLRGRLGGSLIAASWSEECGAGEATTCLSRAETRAATAFLDAWFSQSNLSPDRRWLTAALTAATPTSLSVTQEVRSVRRQRRPVAERRPFIAKGPPPPDRGGRVEVTPGAASASAAAAVEDDDHAPPPPSTSSPGPGSRKRKGGGGRR